MASPQRSDCENARPANGRAALRSSFRRASRGVAWSGPNNVGFPKCSSMPSRRSRERHRVRDWARLLVPLLMIALFAVAAWKLGFFKSAGSQRIVAEAERIGGRDWLAAAFVVIYAALGVVALPMTMLTYAAFRGFSSRRLSATDSLPASASTIGQPWSSRSSFLSRFWRRRSCRSSSRRFARTQLPAAVPTRRVGLRNCGNCWVGSRLAGRLPDPRQSSRHLGSCRARSWNSHSEPHRGASTLWSPGESCAAAQGCQVIAPPLGRHEQTTPCRHGQPKIGTNTPVLHDS